MTLGTSSCTLFQSKLKAVLNCKYEICMQWNLVPFHLYFDSSKISSGNSLLFALYIHVFDCTYMYTIVHSIYSCTYLSDPSCQLCMIKDKSHSKKFDFCL